MVITLPNNSDHMISLSMCLKLLIAAIFNLNLESEMQLFLTDLFFRIIHLFQTGGLPRSVEFLKSTVHL